MDHLSAPPVPKLSEAWIAAHRDSLIRELTAPQRRQLPRRLALTGAGALGTAGACTAAVLFAFGGAGAPNAFAGWSATPTMPESGETASAVTKCTSQVTSLGREKPGGPGTAGGQAIPAEGWQAVVTDTRGPFTAMILQSGSASATCLSGPSFTSTSTEATRSGEGSVHSEHSMSVGAMAGSSATQSSGSAGRTEHGSTVSSIEALSPAGTGPISQASEEQLTVDSGQTYTIVQGQLASGVSGVTLALSDGSTVQATVAAGSFMAWWPGSADATSARVAGASGTTTQQLVFTAQPPPSTPAGASPGESPGPSSSAATESPSSSSSESHSSSSESHGPASSQSHVTASGELPRPAGRDRP